MSEWVDVDTGEVSHDLDTTDQKRAKALVSRQAKIDHLGKAVSEGITTVPRIQRGDLLIWKYIHLPEEGSFVDIRDLCLSRTGTPIWALHGYALAVNKYKPTSIGDYQSIMNDYQISRREMLAALAVIERHRPVFDAFMTISSAPMIGSTGRVYGDIKPTEESVA